MVSDVAQQTCTLDSPPLCKVAAKFCTLTDGTWHEIAVESGSTSHLSESPINPVLLPFYSNCAQK